MQTSRKKTSPKRVLVLPDPGAREGRRREQPLVNQRSPDVHHAIDEFVGWYGPTSCHLNTFSRPVTVARGR
jgi:hypothetical protein